MSRSTPPNAEVAELVAAELRCTVPTAVAEFAARLAGRGGAGVAAVLFYGSALRDESLDGLLDFYVLVDRAREWPASWPAAVANRVLPPNVGYVEEEVDGRLLRAKYAVMTLAQFRRAMSPRAFDTTLWTRFSQPCACVYARGEADLAAVRDAVCGAITTAAYWAAVLGPVRGEPLAYWTELYSRTYELELRVESARRVDLLVGRAPERYARLLPASWRAAGIAHEAESGALRPMLTPAARAKARCAWSIRRRVGRPLNVLRLLKAACTFDRGLDYVVWKVERHSGVKLDVAPWERRFPLLAAPGLYCRLRRRGLLR